MNNEATSTHERDADRALAVCEAALEWVIGRIAQPENFSDSIQYALEQGKTEITRREREAEEAQPPIEESE